MRAGEHAGRRLLALPLCHVFQPHFGRCLYGSLGVPPSYPRFIGVSKAYLQPGLQAPFPTELEEFHGEELPDGREFGDTTGRPRRCGWGWSGPLDLPYDQLGHQIVMTKADVRDAFFGAEIYVGL